MHTHHHTLSAIPLRGSCGPGEVRSALGALHDDCGMCNGAIESCRKQLRADASMGPTHALAPIWEAQGPMQGATPSLNH